ncbi:MAG: DUF2141 domain-containing protein [Dysgonamonadaceae bacterium]|jgi:uncharacterized protein (DUF2141 family)|nr:DUF2141 domain-containing protein [Dysgonamonadaceae bacterium]
MKAKIFMLMLLVAGTLSAQNRLTLIVEGIEEPSGQLMVGLYDKESFMKKPVAVQMVKVNAETVVVVFENVPSGEYALSLFQDENSNGKLDAGLFGIPTEKYGFSNNAKGKYGPPSYEACRFTVDGDLEINILLE